MNKKEIHDFMVDFFQVWKNGDEKRVASFYHPNVKAYSDYSPITLEDILNRFEFAKRKFLTLDHGIQDMFIDEEEGKVAIRMEQRLPLRDDPNQIMECKVISTYRIVDHKITEIWMSFFPNINYLDNK